MLQWTRTDSTTVSKHDQLIEARYFTAHTGSIRCLESGALTYSVEKEYFRWGGWVSSLQRAPM